METTPTEPSTKALSLGLRGAGRKNGGSVMLRHFLLGLVEHSLGPGILDHTSLEIVRCEDAGNAAEIPVGVDMASDSCFLLHVQKSLCVSVAAVWKHSHKQVGLQLLTSVRIHQGRRLASPVHLHGLTRLVIQVHGSFRLMDIFCVVLVELGEFVGQPTVLTPLLAVFHPQQAQGNITLLHLPVYPLV